MDEKKRFKLINYDHNLKIANLKISQNVSHKLNAKCTALTMATVVHKSHDLNEEMAMNQPT